MKWTMKLIVALTAVVLVALAASAIAQTPAPEQTPAEPREEGDRKGEGPGGFGPRRFAQRDECGPEEPGRKMRRIVHSETKFQLEEEGFGIKSLDVGEVTSVDGNRITIKRADGENVSATANDETKVCVDGEEAELSDIDEGDHAALHQSSRNNEKTLKGVRAFSEETPAA